MDTKGFRSDLFISTMKKVGSTNTFSFDLVLLFYLNKEGARVNEVRSKYEHLEGGISSYFWGDRSGSLTCCIRDQAFEILQVRFLTTLLICITENSDGLKGILFRKFILISHSIFRP